MAKKKTTQSKSDTADFSKYIRWFWILFASGIVGFVLLFLFAAWGFLGEMPDHTRLENPETKQATEIYSADSVLLGKF